LIRLLALLAVVWAGCSRHEAPADIVQKYFAAMAAGDCGAIAPLLADEHARCEQMREEYQEQKVEFRGIEKVEPDGRDPTVTLVTAGMRYKKSEHHWVIRVEDHDGHLKLRF
jgi:ketosteroid isomerase-like protein